MQQDQHRISTCEVAAGRVRLEQRAQRSGRGLRALRLQQVLRSFPCRKHVLRALRRRHRGAELVLRLLVPFQPAQRAHGQQRARRRRRRALRHRPPHRLHAPQRRVVPIHPDVRHPERLQHPQPQREVARRGRRRDVLCGSGEGVAAHRLGAVLARSRGSSGST